MQRETCARLQLHCCECTNTILAMNDECPAPAMRRIVHTILFGEYPWQPRLDERDSRIISCPAWPAVERTIAQIAQGEAV